MVDVPREGEAGEGRADGGWMVRIEDRSIQHGREVLVQEALVATVVGRGGREHAVHVVEEGAVRGEQHEARVEVARVDEGGAEAGAREERGEIAQDERVGVDEDDARVGGEVEDGELGHDLGEAAVELGVRRVWRVDVGDGQDGQAVVAHLGDGGGRGRGGDQDDAVAHTGRDVRAVGEEGSHHYADREDVEVAIEEGDVGLARDGGREQEEEEEDDEGKGGYRHWSWWGGWTGIGG